MAISGTSGTSGSKSLPEKKAPRKVSQSSLTNSALHYLQRFSASREQVRQLLQRKVQRSLAHHGDEEISASQAEAWITGVLDSLERQGWLDDRRFAESRARSLAGRGTAVRTIRQKLAQKGVDPDLVSDAIDSMIEENGDADSRDSDLRAAITCARRRRLGPWRQDAEIREARREKDMAALCRQGFGFDIVRQVILAESVEDLEEPEDRA